MDEGAYFGLVVPDFFRRFWVGGPAFFKVLRHLRVGLFDVLTKVFDIIRDILIVLGGGRLRQTMYAYQGRK